MRRPPRRSPQRRLLLRLLRLRLPPRPAASPSSAVFRVREFEASHDRESGETHSQKAQDGKAAKHATHSAIGQTVQTNRAKLTAN